MKLTLNDIAQLKILETKWSYGNLQLTFMRLLQKDLILCDSFLHFLTNEIIYLVFWQRFYELNCSVLLRTNPQLALLYLSRIKNSQ